MVMAYASSSNKDATGIEPHPPVYISPQRQTTSISAKEMSGELPIATIQVPAASGESRHGSAIDFSFNFSAATAGFEIALIEPDGSKSWSDVWQGTDIRVDSLTRSIQANMEGEWLLTVIGKATKSTIGVRWAVSPESNQNCS